MLLECLDALSAAVESIDTTGAEAIEPEVLIESLQGLVRERTPEQQAERIGVAEPPDNLSEMADGRRVVQVSAILTEDVDMPSVRAYMVLAAIAGLGETLACQPAPEDVDGFTGREIDAWVVSEHTDSDLAAAAGSVPDVADVLVFEAVADAALDEPDDVVDVPAAPAAAEAAPVPAAATAADTPAPAAAKPHAKSSGSSTVRVDAERLDQLMHYMGELVLHRTQVEALASQADVPGLAQAMQNLTRTSHALQSMVMQVRMIPVEAVFLRFPRLVRDLSTKLGKQVDLQLVGKDTELDRTVVDALGDPLVHLVRNALDHGLEAPAERERGRQAGHRHAHDLRPARRRQRDHHASRDDGRGIDPRRVAAKAAERGLIAGRGGRRDRHARAPSSCSSPPASRPPRSRATSPAAASGWTPSAPRSAGSAARSLMTSELGQGTSAQIRLPLTLAIMAALIVEADERPFAIPLDRIERTVRVADQAVRSVAGRRMLVLSDGVLPIVDASEQYGGAGLGGRRVRRRRARWRRPLRAHRLQARRPA